MLLKFAYLANLVLAGLLTGNEVGTKAVVHPALDALPSSAQIEAEQAVIGRYGRIMPFLMPLTVLSALPILISIRDRQSFGFRSTLAGVACYAAMVAVTVRRQLPINAQILAFSPQSPPEEFRALRRRWDRGHTLRVALDLAGLICFCLGALARPRSGT